MIELNRRHRNTLARIYARPRRANVSWREFQSLLLALGATVSEGRGSRQRVELNGVRAILHRPHPRKDIDKGMLSSIERFLSTAGVKPGGRDA